MQVGDNTPFFAAWTNVEWLLGGVIGCGAAVAGFVYRLSLRVALLEHNFAVREENDERRHQENLHVARGLQQQLVSLGERIDRLVDRWERRA